MKHWFLHGAVILLAIAWYLIASLSASPASAADPLDAISRALGLVQQGDTDGARKTLAAVAPMPAADPLFAAARGTVELAAGNAGAAEPYFQAALAQDAQLPVALWGKSLCLLQAGRAYEAAAIIDRAAMKAPDNLSITTLRAYACLQLGQLSDAALAGKAALEGGDSSPFLMATLAQVYARTGLPRKAVEFSAFSARFLNGLDISQPPVGVYLPLSIAITDNPAVLTPGEQPAKIDTPATFTAAKTELTPPALVPADEQPRFQILSPARGSTVRGLQQVAVAYRGKREITFVTLLVDGVLRGLVSDMPYQFRWDADASGPGTHRLTVRAYNTSGLVSEETSITVTSTGGKPVPQPARTQRQEALQQQMIALTMPTPSPLSLFSSLGLWRMQLKEYPLAISSLEKSVAIDPLNEKLSQALQDLYREQGLHPLTPTGDVYRGPATGNKRVALTFDDGPNPLYTPSIMAQLARYDARATFFLVGKMVQRYPNLTMELLANGHELANHTYHHPNLTKLEPREIISEMLLARSVIKDVTGRDTYLFRPPGGNIDDAVTKQLRALDYNTIYWSINAGEYVKSPPAEQAALILSRIEDGSIVLLHNGPVDGTPVILPMLLEELTKRGFTCVTVSELMKDK